MVKTIITVFAHELLLLLVFFSRMEDYIVDLMHAVCCQKNTLVLLLDQMINEYLRTGKRLF